MANIFKTSLGIDLGCNYTGLFLTTHPANSYPTSDDCLAATLVMSEDGDKMTYSQAARTATRHRLRGNKRFTMVRRLLLSIVSTKLTFDMLSEVERNKAVDALFGMMKRRGYSRLESETEIDTNLLDSLDSAVFADHEDLTAFFNSTASLSTQVEALSDNPQAVSALLAANPGSKAFVQYVKTEYPEYKTEAKAYGNALSDIINVAKSLDMQLNLGHQHRTKYLEAIRADMFRDSRLKPVIDAFGSADVLWHLVGNLSNLQLRALRWYFNSKTFAMPDAPFDSERLRSVLVRAYKYFHPAKGQEAERIRSVITAFENTDDIVETLCTLDPVGTIPPYEDQNNRRPPVDQTLLLSPAGLTKHFSNAWKAWALSLAKAEPILESELDEILGITDRRSRIKANHAVVLPAEDYFASYVLQRALDRNKLRDKYALRLLATGAGSQEAISRRHELELTIGSQHVDSFIRLCALYYSEVDSAKKGLWLQNDMSLLERSDLHPPMKTRVLNQLVAGVFSKDDWFGERFIAEAWGRTVTGRSSVRSMCQTVEKIRKDFGGAFNDSYRLAVWRAEKHGRAFKPDAEEKELLRVHTIVTTLSKFFTDILKLDPVTVRRVSNPYSLAQLYTLLETERNGFTSTCLAVHKENRWRMSADDGSADAQCSRLPADSVRPFDGVLRRSLSRQASEIAKLVAEQLTAKKLTNTQIDCNVFIEENKFEFAASLLQIKKNRVKQKKAEEQTARQLTRWASKEDRLRAAARGICAYTGKGLGTQPEIDHIIPRSLTTASMGTIFNSEANLILVSQEGNQRKGNARYRLSDLNSKYLQAVFGTTDLHAIEEKIEATVAGLARDHKIATADLLTPEEMDCVRHALFLDDASDARKTVIATIAATRRSRVNGSQAWLVREYISVVRKLLADWCQKNNNTLTFNAVRTSAQAGHEIRKALAAAHPRFIKPEIQPVASHSVDAMCAYAAACASESTRRAAGAFENISDTESFSATDPHGLPALHNGTCRIINLDRTSVTRLQSPASRSIFKESIYAENFLHLFTLKNKLYAGFSLPADGGSTCGAEVGGKDPFALLKLLAPVLERPVTETSDKPVCYRIDRTKAFETMSRIACAENPSAEEMELVQALEALRYFTSRKTVSAKFLDQTGRKFVTRETLEKSLSFDVKVDLPKKRPYALSTVLTLPAKTDWMHLIDAPELADRWGKAVEDFDLSQWVSQQMNMNSAHKRLKHTAVIRNASLPVCDSPSGGFRLRRTSIKNETVFQTVTINAEKYVGFSTDNGQTLWNTPALFDHLKHGKVAPSSIETGQTASIVRMDAWRHIFDDETVSIDMCPGSKSRCYIRLRTDLTTFAGWIKMASEGKITLTDIFSLPSEINSKDLAKKFKEAVGQYAELLGTPRTNIFMRQLGQRIVCEYGVMGTSKSQKDAYDQGSVK